MLNFFSFLSFFFITTLVAMDPLQHNRHSSLIDNQWVKNALGYYEIESYPVNYFACYEVNILRQQDALKEIYNKLEALYQDNNQAALGLAGCFNDLDRLEQSTDELSNPFPRTSRSYHQYNATPTTQELILCTIKKRRSRRKPSCLAKLPVAKFIKKEV
jgi:hypothetical protein